MDLKEISDHKGSKENEENRDQEEIVDPKENEVCKDCKDLWGLKENKDREEKMRIPKTWLFSWPIILKFMKKSLRS